MDKAYDYKKTEAVEPPLDAQSYMAKTQNLYTPKWKVETHPLSDVFKDAVSQATEGKGKERHGKEKEFFSQPWVEIADTHGIGFLTGQAEKKLREAMLNLEIGSDEWWEKEMLGCLNYLAMAVLYKRRGK